MMSPEPISPGHLALWTDLTPFDWVLVVVLASSMLLAFLRGAIRETAALVGTVAGLLLAAWNYPAVSPYVSRWVGSGPPADGLAFLLIVSGVMVVCSLGGRIVRSGAHFAGLGLLDRLAGSAIGLVRGVLAAAAITFAITAFLPGQSTVAGSRLAPYLLAAAHGVSSVVPQHLQQKFSNGAAGLWHSRVPRLSPVPAGGDEAHTRHGDSK